MIWQFVEVVQKHVVVGALGLVCLYVKKIAKDHVMDLV